METEKIKEIGSKRTFSRTTTTRTREVKIRLLGNLPEQKIHYVAALGPQMQLGTPPRASRKIAAMVLIHLNHLLRQLLRQPLLAKIVWITEK